MPGFQDVVGHGQIISYLKNAICLNKISHAYIFDGQEHSGKRMLAEAFAMTLQCETVQRVLSAAEETEAPPLFQMPSSLRFGISDAARGRAELTEPCLECRSCRQAAGKNQPDVVHVTHEKTAISVDDIRAQINRDIGIRPYGSRYKIYIIDEAEKMNAQAQNALLKTIEEPPAYAVVLLLTTNADTFLPTVRSRCVTLNLRAVEEGRIRDFLMRRYRVPDYQADLCAAFAQGNVGQAILLASSEQFNELKNYIIQLMRRLGEIPVYDLMKELEPMRDQKENISIFFDLVLFLFRDVLLYKAVGAEGCLIFREQASVIAHVADRCSFEGANRMLRALETASHRLRSNVNYMLTLEVLLMDMKESLR